MTQSQGSESCYAVVAIGRNEGERLRQCLESVVGRAALVVYVDSGSTDGSVAMAQRMGAEVVSLDMGLPFTAARARNEGFIRVREVRGDVPYVQFVDGDCEVVPGWLEAAAAFLDERVDVGIVCGRRRERYPERSVYNMLCDIEWNTPVGEAKACGGDAMMRADAFTAVGGFAPSLIAGEEPELCVRLRAAAWRVWRLERDMTLHDAAMMRFAQWWKRAMRSGHAMAEGAYLHGRAPERHRVRETFSVWFWAAGVPLIAGACATLAWPHGLAVLVAYPLQIARLALRGSGSRRERWWRAVFLVIGKWAELGGQLVYLKRRWLRERALIIEYK